jgi:hypothetical protein
VTRFLFFFRFIWVGTALQHGPGLPSPLGTIERNYF